MKRMAKFEKISFDNFRNNLIFIKTKRLFFHKYQSEIWKPFDSFSEEELKTVYDSICLPMRGTKGSAGYDFFFPCDLTLKPGESISIPTFIRCWMEPGWVLQIFPRSSLGKYRLQLNDTTPIIDSDYYYAKNEGHIGLCLTNDSHEHKTLVIEKGKGICQGLFVKYGITYNDSVMKQRIGGYGSTN